MMDLAQVAEASSKLSLMLEQVLSYVDDVLAGKQLPDNQVDVDAIREISFHSRKLVVTALIHGDGFIVSGGQSTLRHGAFCTEDVERSV